jgi:hypothetical protein
MSNLINSTKNVFDALCIENGFVQKELGPDDVALIKGNFAIRLFRDREGMSMTYVRREKSGVKEYPLGDYLAINRKWMLPELNMSRNENELEAFALTLRTSAKDILNGDELWIQKTATTALPVADATCKLLGI